MTWQSAEQTALDRFETLITTGQLLLTSFPNQAFTKPDSEIPYCSVHVLNAGGFQASFGSPGANRHRSIDILEVLLHYPLLKGSKAASDMAEIIRTAFRAVHVNGVAFGSPTRDVKGRVGDRYQVNITIPFHFDDFG